MRQYKRDMQCLEYRNQGGSWNAYFYLTRSSGGACHPQIGLLRDFLVEEAARDTLAQQRYRLLCV